MLTVEYKEVIMNIIRTLRIAGSWNEASTIRSGEIYGVPLSLRVDDADMMMFSLFNAEAHWEVKLQILKRDNTFDKDLTVGDVVGNMDACVRDLIFVKMALN